MGKSDAKKYKRALLRFNNPPTEGSRPPLTVACQTCGEHRHLRRDILTDSSHVHASDRCPARGTSAAHCLGSDTVPAPAAEPGAGQRVAAAEPTTKHLHPPLHPGLMQLLGVVVPPGCGDGCWRPEQTLCLPVLQSHSQIHNGACKTWFLVLFSC